MGRESSSTRSDRRKRSRSRSRSPKRRDTNTTNGNGAAADEDGELPNAPKKTTGVSLSHLGLSERAAAMKKKAKVDADAAAKPTFLTKAQRRELAVKRLEDKRQAQMAKLDEERKARQQYLDKARGGRSSSSSSSSSNRREERRKRDERREERHADRDSRKKADNKQAEIDAIKQSYLGGKPRKKRRMASRTKFNFDWDGDEDTSETLNSLYTKRANVAMMFGRGYIAGVDREQQSKHTNTVYHDLVKKRQKQDDYALDDSVLAAKAARKERQQVQQAERKRRNRHWSDKPVDEMETRDWRILNEDFNISCRGKRIPRPIRFWKESGLPQPILTALAECGYKEPSPIQRQAIPIGLENRDCVGIAKTGSGKTCAFVLPMLVYISKLPPMTEQRALDGPYAIILAPTRELANQIQVEAIKFSRFMSVTVLSIVGGVDIAEQSAKIRQGAEVIVATPGRLFDCIGRRFLVLNQCNYIVLDEADRMIDMGFEDQVMAIMDAMPSSNLRPENEEDELKHHIYRQTFMFSATMPATLEKIARKHLRNPTFVAVGSESGEATNTVKQNVLWIEGENKKMNKLFEVLQRIEFPAMIFMAQKKTCDGLCSTIESKGYTAGALHGGKSQDLRESIMASFRNKEFDVLICTNVAARGIDVKGIKHVINFDMPNNIQDYTHRIGRTGRAGEKGEATSLLLESDAGDAKCSLFYDLKQMLVAGGHPVPRELAKHDKANQKPGEIGRGPRKKILYVT